VHVKVVDYTAEKKRFALTERREGGKEVRVGRERKMDVNF
jgi:hypothetical protein